MSLKEFVKSKFTTLQQRRIRGAVNYFKSIGHTHDLTRLAQIYKTDKWGGHSYTPHYKTHLKKFRFKKVNLLEIGVGGYDDTQAGGESLRMWKRYFPLGKIYSIDIYNKSSLEEKRIKIFQGSQVDDAFITDVLKQVSEWDIIIDDGSHINSHVIHSFKRFFPALKDGGVYVIEDVQTSYWMDYGGDSTNLQNPNTIMTFFKSLTDGLNHTEFIKPGYEPSYFDMNITSIHFYHNLIFICKGRNMEESNLIKNNQKPNI
ncbi:class I SAM-dependent methyltransferase [Chryseolinea sp. H1M3-3]|uniref:class I SAM-dependent methyltransferase n=1 Tax=Chryseolinea sp. H1M3-3 TaxID=3034144 RepID=UPI0023ECF8A3|nr:class I SAM-dependent methyltransferase [Chryseolinea sp. H1M3-3]